MKVCCEAGKAPERQRIKGVQNDRTTFHQVCHRCHGGGPSGWAVLSPPRALRPTGAGDRPAAPMTRGAQKGKPVGRCACLADSTPKPKPHWRIGSKRVRLPMAAYPTVATGPPRVGSFIRVPEWPNLQIVLRRRQAGLVEPGDTELITAPASPALWADA